MKSFLFPPALVLIVLFPFSPGRAAPPEKALQALHAALRGKTPDLEKAGRALAELKGTDSPALAKALFKAACLLDSRVEQWDRERVETWTSIQELLRGKGPGGRLGLQGTRKKEFLALMARARTLRGKLDRARPFLVRLRKRIQALSRPESLEKLAREGLFQEKVPFRVRLAVARVVARRSPRALDFLGKALARARNPGAKAALLEGLRLLGKDAAPLGEKMLKLLKDPAQVVREEAARALSRAGTPQAVLPMIGLLEKEKGLARERIAGFLEEMTGMKLGLSLPAWRNWFAKESKRILSGEYPLGAPPEAERKRPATRGWGGGKGRKAGERRWRPPQKKARSYYMGIPQDGKSLVYLLDASNSMKAPIRLNVTGTSSGREETSRFDACRRELIKSLSALAPDQEFNVIFFNNLVLAFRPRPVPATKENVARAIHWILQVRMRLLTDIYSALQLAFSMAGGPKEDPLVGDGVDTIFLLTDGAPYIKKENGKSGRDRIPDILLAVSEWDPLKRVRIHCITVGKSLGRGVRKGFLRRLAALGGGEFREY